MEDQQITLARAAYQRYGAVTDFKNFQGNPMPTWDELPPKIKEAWVAAANPMPTVDSINRQIGILLGGEDELGNELSAGELSDGYHTFNELYDHRITLWIALCKSEYDHNNYEGITTNPVWRTQVHSDGSVWADWFLLGIGKESGKQITYHLPISRWTDCSFAETLDQAPPFDGHTSTDVLQRLKAL